MKKYFETEKNTKEKAVKLQKARTHSIPDTESYYLWKFN